MIEFVSHNSDFILEITSLYHTITFVLTKLVSIAHRPDPPYMQNTQVV